MRTLIYVLLSIILASTCWATNYVWYLTASGEVENIDTVLRQKNTAIYTLAIDPTISDGIDLTPPNGDADVLGYAKIYDSGVVRNATQGEIDGFAAYRVDSQSQLEADRATAYVINDPSFRRIMKAIDAILVNEFNRHRDFELAVKQATADATSLADFKSRMAAITNVNERSVGDLLDAIRNRIDKDD